MIDIASQQRHDNDLEEEVHHRNIKQAEQEHPEGAEIEGKQTVPLHQRQGVSVELLMCRCWHLVHAAIFLTEYRHQPLELRGRFLLFDRIVDVGFLEPSLIGRGLFGHLVVDFLLTGRIIELAVFLALQEEEMYLNIIVGQSLLATYTHKA